MNLISVIIPVYNVERYLDKCISSVVHQTYSNLEIILVDDGSPDRCPEMCEKWAKKDSRIRVIHKKNGGLSDARNAGLNIASGNLIGFVDPDDWIAPEMYERLEESMDTEQSEISACSVLKVRENGLPDKLLTVQSNAVLNNYDAQRNLLHETGLKQPVWYKLYKREVIGDIRFETGKKHEDNFWSYRVIGNANKVSIIDYVGYYYLQRKESIMGSGYSLKSLDALEACEKRFSFFTDSYSGLLEEARINLLESCIFHGQMVLKYLKGEERIYAFNYLNRMFREYRISNLNYSNLKRTHQLWLRLADISLPLVCKIKNLLNIGI